MTDKKMTGKSPKVGAIDLESLANWAGEADNNVPAAAVVPAQTSKSAPPERQKSVKPAKPVHEHRTEHVKFRLTLKEMDKLKSKAGLIPVSTYLRKILEEQDVI